MKLLGQCVKKIGAPEGAPCDDRLGRKRLVARDLNE
jgi:hypothetical protein